jgi:membrane-associated phospholipid phosphatase
MWLTKIGEGWQFGIAFFILLFISFRDAAAVVVCALGVLFISAALKNLVFPDALRPTAYLEGYDLRLIPGLKMHSRHSFPSGHTMATFGSLVFFAFYFRSSVLNWFLAILALFTALSRVYLSQHFMADIVAGAWIGSLIASISYSWSRTWTSTFWSKKIGKGGRSS